MKMKQFIFKCVFLLCVASLFVGVKCDQWLLDNSRDDLELNQFIACAAEFLRNESDLLANKMPILEAVYHFCHEKEFAALTPVIESKSSEIVQLICRDADAVVISVQSNAKSNPKDADFTRELYVVKVEESGDQLPSKVIYMSDSTHVKLEGLASDENFNVTVGIVSAMREYRVLPDIVVRTLPSIAYRPQTIPSESIIISDFATNEEPNLLSAYVQWAPADDMVCHYGMILYELKENAENEHAFQAFKISDSQNLFRFKVSNLVLGSYYHLAIRGINTKTESIEGMESSITFATPSCWEVHAFNTTLCPPEPHQNLTSTHALVTKEIYNINVTWEPIEPKRQPIYYIVSILPHYTEMHEADDAEQSVDIVSLNVTGDKNYAYFHHIKLNSVNYIIQVEAFSNGGSILMHAEQSLKEIYKSYLDSHQESIKTIRILVPLLIVLLTSLLLVIALYRRMKLKRDNADESRDLHELLSAFHRENKVHDLEVNLTQITYNRNEMLGEGAYGIVYKGKIMPQSRLKFNWGLLGLRQLKPNQNGLKQSMDVAVKMLKKDNGDGIRMSAKVKEFLDEIKVMKSVVGQHENIINIVGHYTCCKDYKQLMLLTEYCTEGNLLKYLRQFQRQVPEGLTSQETCIVEIDDSWECNRLNMVENPGYDIILPHEINSKPSPAKTMQSKIETMKGETLTSADLLNFAIQIAHGMAFLASKSLLHRDLAARNILVCANKMIKIADFGLSRDIYVDNIYTKSSDGRVPLRWLALESLDSQQYTSQSDVWSYGILLYEIVTLGRSPYPELPNVSHVCLLNYLKEGKRMSRPNGCSQNLYEIMLDCWNGDSSKRPSFTLIGQRLEKLAEQ